MKKLFPSTATLVLTFVVAEAETLTSAASKTTTEKFIFEKSLDGVWMGTKNTWYKLNATDNSVWWSADGKVWNAVNDGMWQDLEGKWLKIAEQKLWWSLDGKAWAQTPEWKWQGVNGVWNKFDQEWNLWTAKM